MRLTVPVEMFSAIAGAGAKDRDKWCFHWKNYEYLDRRLCGAVVNETMPRASHYIFRNSRRARKIFRMYSTPEAE